MELEATISSQEYLEEYQTNEWKQKVISIMIWGSLSSHG